MGPWTFAWICCPQLPYHPCQNGTHSTCFCSTGGHTPREVLGSTPKFLGISRKFSEVLRSPRKSSEVLGSPRKSSEARHPEQKLKTYKCSKKKSYCLSVHPTLLHATPLCDFEAFLVVLHLVLCNTSQQPRDRKIHEVVDFRKATLPSGHTGDLLGRASAMQPTGSCSA